MGEALLAHLTEEEGGPPPGVPPGEGQSFRVRLGDDSKARDDAQGRGGRDDEAAAESLHARMTPSSRVIACRKP